MNSGDTRFDSWPKEGTYIVYLVKTLSHSWFEPTWRCDVMSVNSLLGTVHVLHDAEFSEHFLSRLCERPY